MRTLFSFSSTNPIPAFLSKSRFISFDSVRSLSFKLPPPSASRSSKNPMTTAVAIPPKSAASMTTSNEEGLARRLWVKFRRESVFAMHTPFAVCLASGTLRIDSFRNYIAQDFLFLKAFAQAFELAEDCSDDDDAKLAITELRKSVLVELKLHDSLIREWGLDLAKDVRLKSSTVKYTEFLIATASGKVEGLKAPGKLATPFEKTKVAAYTLAAMTPCMRLYAFLAKEFEAILDPNKDFHPYKNWINNYTSESFEASALQTEDLLDKLSVSMTGEELDIIENLYHQAMKHEIDFFHSQPLEQPTVIPLIKGHTPTTNHLVIFSDFDLTCTIVDSSAILAEIAIVTAPKSDQNQPERQIARMQTAELRNSWNLLSKQYTEEYEECIENLMPPKKIEKFNYDALRKALGKLSDFENKANSRVIESGVLKGLNYEDIKRAGERLILQDGCTNFFQNIVQNESLSADVHVLSYCWCAHLIRAAFSSGGLDALNIHANEFAYHESISTGEIVRRVESPIDKVQAFENILNNLSPSKKKLSVYIGDSVGDLLCLLKADIGIVIGSSSSLRRVGNQFGVSFVPLFTGLVQKQKEHHGEKHSTWNELSGTLYTVSCWAEIHAFILGW